MPILGTVASGYNVSVTPTVDTLIVSGGGGTSNGGPASGHPGVANSWNPSAAFDAARALAVTFYHLESAAHADAIAFA